MWYDNPKHLRRLAAEKALLLTHFPSASLVLDEQHRLMWSLPVFSLRGRRYDVALVYPPDFPAGPIQAYILDPEIRPGVPHRYAGGSLCLGHSSTPHTSALTTAVWVCAWASAYELWLLQGSWPEFRRAG